MSDIDSARQALEDAARYAKSAEDGEARARGLSMVADGYRRLWETTRMWAREYEQGPIEMRTFTGEMDAEVELWLGEAFESWLPSARQLLIKINGFEVRVVPGQRLVKLPDGEVLVSSSPAPVT